ncbi:MAG: 50S ribosomal protein L20 [Candidatus Pacebacteria bacterium CG10_big_fil_rev_8_21_14_0_10_56_10]|nr:MAG: 50S ribosomal protein L20 [Candidatus Pacebacteria bacterium CG10_big_fil_rev_8_21_14_0_10_56_10]
MPRTTTGTTRRHRHKKVLSQTKGYRGANNRLYKRAKEALLHAGQYAYIGRKLRKRDLRQLWIIRINAGVRAVDDNLNYSRFMKALKANHIALNRKMLAELAATDPATFSSIVDQVR